MTYEEYLRLTGGPGGIVDILGLPAGVEDVDLDILQRRDLPRPVDLT
jgi:hypothetical protein